MNDNQTSFSYQAMKEQEERLKLAVEQRNNKINEYNKIVDQLEKHLKKFSRVYNVECYNIEPNPSKWKFIVSVDFRYYGEYKASFSYEIFEKINVDEFWGQLGLDLSRFIEHREGEIYGVHSND